MEIASKNNVIKNLKREITNLQKQVRKQYGNYKTDNKYMDM